MHLVLNRVLLRRPELKDIDELYRYRNDSRVVATLGGFSFGYSVKDLTEWIEFHRTRKDEIIWTIAEHESDRCLGHVGLYQINGRSRHAEFAIMIGDPSFWGAGIGSEVSAAVVAYGFEQLNLNRIELTVLSGNSGAVRLYEKLGFVHEGVSRQKEFRNGRYLDVIHMGMLTAEWKR